MGKPNGRRRCLMNWLVNKSSRPATQATLGGIAAGHISISRCRSAGAWLLPLAAQGMALRSPNRLPLQSSLGS